MRYIQMIKRCKIPLKKATSDMEAHGEEQAKRCTMSTADLRTSVPCWEDRLGHLRHSAVARLLVEGKLPVDSGTSGPLGDCGSAMDLSKSSVLDKARNFHRDDYRMKSESVDLMDATADCVRQQMGVEMEALKTRSSGSEVRFGGWKCRYCPYTANTSKKLYSHYQFHQQLLASQSSKPHMEWLTAYRRAKDFSDGKSTPVTPSLNVTSSTNMASPSQGGDLYASNNGTDRNSPAPMFPPGCFPPSLDDPERLQAMRANGMSLRYLLGGKGYLSKQTAEEQNSASGCLRSIVQAVMQQGTRASQASVTTTSVYASLVNSSSGSLSLKMDQREPPCSVSGPVAPSVAHLPNQPAILADAHVNTVSGNMQVPMYMDGTKIVRPEPRRANALNLQTQNSLTLSGAHVDCMTQHPQSDHVIYKHTGAHCPLPENASLNSPARRTVTVECQVPLSVPERPVSRESSSSFTSSASSEINVDDSPTPYNNRRTDSFSSERCHGDIGNVRLQSRKRSHSLDSDSSCRGLSLHHPVGSGDLYELSSRTEELEMNPTTKMIRLDYAYDSHVKEERAITPEAAKPGNASPTAVISSTGTPPPITHGDGREEQGTPRDGMDNMWKPTVSTQDTSIQCELLVPPSGNGWTNPQLLGPEAFTNSPDQMTNRDGGYFQRSVGSPIVIGSVKCPHCGIMFDDSVLHSIHMGCHSHSDPFICNVCGEQCCNKYGFYTHIMRGHHKH